MKILFLSIVQSTTDRVVVCGLYARAAFILSMHSHDVKKKKNKCNACSFATPEAVF